MIADFYHLTALPVERVLPRICERLLEEGQRLLIVAEKDLLSKLDEQLWTYERDAFLPHGQEDVADPLSQPILLSSQVTPLNGAQNVAIADGVWREEALGFDRLFYFFDEERRADARRSWTMLKDNREVERRYWKQDEAGRWAKGP